MNEEMEFVTSDCKNSECVRCRSSFYLASMKWIIESGYYDKSSLVCKECYEEYKKVMKEFWSNEREEE